MSSDKPEQPKRPIVTGKLDANQKRAIIVPALGSFGTRFSSTEVIYHPVPYNYKIIQDPTPWRVLLKFGAPAPRIVVGLDIYGDVIIGRGSDGPQSPDIDLSNLDALALGVSRRHALLRPTQNKLFLIDLDSTNGSYVNAIPVGRGMAQVLKGGDTVALAGLNFVVEIVRAPQRSKEAEEEQEVESEQPKTTLKVGEDAPPPKEKEKESTASLPLPRMARPKQGKDTLPPGVVPGVKEKKDQTKPMGKEPKVTDDLSKKELKTTEEPKTTGAPSKKEPPPKPEKK